MATAKAARMLRRRDFIGRPQAFAAALYTRVLEKAKGRVIRSDTGFPENGDLAPEPIPDTWEAAREGFEIEIKPLFVDYTLK